MYIVLWTLATNQYCSIAVFVENYKMPFLLFFFREPFANVFFFFIYLLVLVCAPYFFSFYWSMSDCKLRWRIVSLTALKTTLIFSVSTAVVKWWKSGFLGSLFTDTNMSRMKFCTSFMECESPLNCGKYQRTSVSGDLTFLSSRSVLFRKRMIDTLPKIMLFTIVSNIFLDSSSLLVRLWKKNCTCQIQDSELFKLQETIKQ